MVRRISPIRDFVSLLRLIKVIHRESPDILHSITPKAGLLSMAAGTICKVPHRIHTFTGLVFPTAKGLKRRLLMFTDALTCKFATKVHAEGRGVRNDLINFKITRKPIEILQNGSLKGVNSDYFNPSLSKLQQKANELKSNGQLTFIFIGRIAKEKGINELIAGFVKINKVRPDCRLWLLGLMENEIDPLSISTLNEIKNNNAIKYLGYQKDIRPWLLASDCLILPSYREGFPNVVLEAGAMGKPCIVTDINGSNEIIVNNETGWIVPPKDIESLYSVMMEVMLRRNELRKIGEEARQRVISRYNYKDVQTTLISYYKNLT